MRQRRRERLRAKVTERGGCGAGGEHGGDRLRLGGPPAERVVAQPRSFPEALLEASAVELGDPRAVRAAIGEALFLQQRREGIGREWRAAALPALGHVCVPRQAGATSRLVDWSARTLARFVAQVEHHIFILDHCRPRRFAEAPAAVQVRRHVARPGVGGRVVVVCRESAKHEDEGAWERIEYPEGAESLTKQRLLRWQPADRTLFAARPAHHVLPGGTVRGAALLMDAAKVVEDRHPAAGSVLEPQLQRTSQHAQVVSARVGVIGLQPAVGGGHYGCRCLHLRQ
eukprot:scaffold22411_cov110-Isochrysis_galbana.AAC.2